jgi:hypothetical protein
MLAASHALIGASIAQIIPNPYLGLPLSLLSHFLGDLIPHWDFRTRKVKRKKLTTITVSLTDAAIGFGLGLIFFGSQIPLKYLVAMMFAAQLPDWIEAPFHILEWNFPPFSSIKKLQSRLHNKKDLPWGLALQLLVVVALLYFVA